MNTEINLSRAFQPLREGANNTLHVTLKQNGQSTDPTLGRKYPLDEAFTVHAENDGNGNVTLISETGLFVKASQEEFKAAGLSCGMNT